MLQGSSLCVHISSGQKWSSTCYDSFKKWSEYSGEGLAPLKGEEASIRATLLTLGRNWIKLHYDNDGGRGSVLWLSDSWQSWLLGPTRPTTCPTLSESVLIIEPLKWNRRLLEMTDSLAQTPQAPRHVFKDGINWKIVYVLHAPHASQLKCSMYDPKII